MIAGDSATDTQPRWRCAHATPARIKTLVDYYSHRLRSRAIDVESARMWAGIDADSAPPSSAATTTTTTTTTTTGTSQDNAIVVDEDQAPASPASGTNEDDTIIDNKHKKNISTSTSNSDNNNNSNNNEKRELTQKELFDLSVAMARKAFLTPPEFLLPDDDMDPLPAHCVHLDILSAPALRAALAARDAATLHDELRRGATASFETVLFAFADHASCASGDVGIDRDDVVRLFDSLATSPLDNFSIAWSEHMRRALTLLQQGRQAFLQKGTTLLFDALPIANSALLERCVCCLFLTLPAVSMNVVPDLCRALTTIVDDADNTLSKLLGRLGADALRTMVLALQSHFTMYLMESNHAALNAIASALSLLHKANTAVTSRGILPFSIFHNATAIEFNDQAILQDFTRAARAREEAAAAGDSNSNSNSNSGGGGGGGASSLAGLFSFSRFPCLVDTRFKSKLLQIEGAAQQQQAQRDAIFGIIFGGRGGRRDVQAAQEDMYCVMRIRRAELIPSTLREMQRNRSRLNKPLKVVFVGEEGIDAGGVTKEYFQLLTRTLLVPSYGMFSQRDPERVLWLMPDVQTQQLGSNEFFLVGQVLGLAVYNNVIIDVAFPQLLYRRLLDIEPDMEDLKEIDAAFAAGLQKLLEYDERATPDTPSVEDVFCRNFTYTHDVFGSSVEREIVPGGANIALTGANRREYVRAMIKYLLVDSVANNFSEFRRGFTSVAGARDLVQTMHPVELEQLLCGQPTIDLDELEATSRYEGYRKSDQVVQWFWKTVKSFSVEQQKKFLHFCTGSDRVPIGGLRELEFIIGKNGDSDLMLPASHTCFNHFLLPKYSTEAVLREKLLQAIENCEGFGLE